MFKEAKFYFFWQQNEISFALFVLMTVSAAAGGYCINDIIDEKIDALNKPQKQVVGVSMSSESAWRYYSFFVVLGGIASLTLCFLSHHWLWLAYYGSASWLLFAYSRWLKQRVLVGNIVVAIFTACVAWGTALPLPDGAFSVQDSYKIRLQTLLFYCFFAFCSNFWREIVKDIEDAEGDAAQNCQTMPIVWGVKTSKTIANIVAMSLLLAIFYFSYVLFDWYNTRAYNTFPSIIWLSATIVFPIFQLLYLQYIAEEKADFSFISSLLKGLMLAGLLFLVVFKAFIG